MKPIGNIVFGIVIILVCFSAIGSVFTYHRPEGFSVRLVGSGEDVLISATESYLRKTTYYRHGTMYERRVRFTVSERELERLYALIRKNRFDEIKTVRKHIPGRTGDDKIIVTIGSQVIEKSNQGDDVVAAFSLSRFREIADAILALKERKLRRVRSS